METPFVYGRIATQKNFTDRESETKVLVQNFKSLINTIIISPRRWGKSSLVNKAAEIAKSEDSSIRICHIDLFNVRKESDFYAQLAKEVVKQTSSKFEEMLETTKKFLSHLMPSITISPDSINQIDFDMKWKDQNTDIDEILDLPEKVAQAKGLKIVICIDEFQNISTFTDPNFFQKNLRSHWQTHQNVSYCLYGSKRNMMLQVFTDTSMPFYKFGNIMFLNKIETPYLIDFFKSRFEDTGKSIEDDAAELIAILCDNHPYYAQQLAQISWFRTEDTCTTTIVKQAHAALVEQLSYTFDSLTQELTTQQLNYLHALLSKEEAISSTDTMHKYGITSATSVTRSKKALLAKDTLDEQHGVISFQDPIYAFWLKNRYFK